MKTKLVIVKVSETTGPKSNKEIGRQKIIPGHCFIKRVLQSRKNARIVLLDSNEKTTQILQGKLVKINQDYFQLTTSDGIIYQIKIQSPPIFSS